MKKIVKFTKTICPHCDVFAPIFKTEIENHKDHLEFFEINLDDAPQMREIFKIRGVPSLYTFESEDFKEFQNIKQLTIGHSHEGYQEFKGSLENLKEKNE